MSKDKLPAKPEITFEHDGNQIGVKVPDTQMLLDLFGTDDLRLATALLFQAAGAVGTNDDSHAEQGRDFMLAIIEDFAPQDATKRLLSVQTAATHASLMAVSSKLNNSTSLQGHEVHERSFNRLARTFTAKAEALRKHRNGGRSKVVVEHVTVNEGGQAIVGNRNKSRRSHWLRRMTASSPKQKPVRENNVLVVVVATCTDFINNCTCKKQDTN